MCGTIALVEPPAVRYYHVGDVLSCPFNAGASVLKPVYLVRWRKRVRRWTTGDTVLLKSIRLTNFLSFGDKGESIDLLPLNVVIGPNGSGKSNLLEAIDLIRSAPRDLLAPIREGGGVREWIWKGAPQHTGAIIDVVVGNRKPTEVDLRYVLGFTEVAQRFEILDERIENAQPRPGNPHPNLFYHFVDGRGVLIVREGTHQLQLREISHTASILAQRKDPDQYPELTWLGDAFSEIHIYREWSFGRYTAPRLPQKADLPNKWLEPDARNLGLVLNRLRRDPAVKKRFLDALRALYGGIDDFDVQIEGGTVQVFFQEGNYIVPATRLSDGTLRYLCMLAILCHPAPPPLVCIEEPELGLHPDVLVTLAGLIKEAAEKTQLIVTTHSDILVDAFSDQPECVLVAERDKEGTTLTRLDSVQLGPWLERYRLGELWTRGDIGGTRW